MLTNSLPKPNSAEPTPRQGSQLMDAIRKAPTHFDWVNVPFIAVFHVLAVVALFHFSWARLAVAVGLYIVTALGITVGYHRLITHKSFKTPKWLEYMWSIAGVLALQGGPITWVALHRQHHNESDRDMDPHNISRGFFFAHIWWLLRRPPADLEMAQRSFYAPELLRDPLYRWLEKYQIVPTVILGVGLLLLGGWPMLLWGLFLRTVALYHATWCVNSAAHVWGGRPFADSEGTNNWWVAVLAMGEGWHNNHHKFPTSARHGLRNWQFDASWIVIKSMSWMKLASNIKRPPPASLPWMRPKGTVPSKA